MKKNQTKGQNNKKEKDTKNEVTSKKDNKEKNSKEDEKSDSESVEYYTDEEIKLLDLFQDFSENKFSDDEIYKLMLKYHNNEEEIKHELKEMMKDLKRGEEYSWTEISKSN